MFKIENNHIVYGNSKYLIPPEVSSKKVLSISGTATCGLDRKVAMYDRNRDGHSVSAICEGGEPISGYAVGQMPQKHMLVYLREQLEPSGKSFWLVSHQEIKNDMNWINVKFEDGTTLNLCPFTSMYWIT